jgi:probable rRNA maturation factor
MASRPEQAPPPVGSVAVHAADEQDETRVDAGRWADLAGRVLDAEGVPPGAEMTLLFVDEARMAELNALHLGVEGPTDVLSFPIDEVGGGPHREAPFEATVEGQPVLVGDVVVCPAVARRQAAEHDETYEDEVALLVVHGVLHLLGHDHAEPEERRIMQDRESVWLERFHREDRTGARPR